jgi:hypothetical protein
MRKPIPHKKLVILSCVLVLVIGGALLTFKLLMNKREPGNQAVSVQKETLVIYYPGAQGLLKKKDVEVGNDLPERAKADVIMAELKKEDAVPETLAVRDMAVDSEGVMYLNLSHDIKSEDMGTVQEITTLYSIINSFLSNFKSSKRVQVLIEGQAFYTVNGVLYTYNPIEFNNNLVEE